MSPQEIKKIGSRSLVSFVSLMMVFSPCTYIAHADTASDTNVVTADTTPPTITAPSEQTFSETVFPASPTLTQATATDDIDPNPSITYSPTSFPVGTTTVTWTTTDASGNSSTATSNVILIDVSSAGSGSGTGSSSGTGTSTPITTPSMGTAHLLVRDGATIAWSGDVTFPIGTSTTDVTPTEVTHPNSSATPIAVSDQSLLGVLEHVQQSETAFSLSNIEYYTSFSEFLLDCVTVPSVSSNPACYNWQYQINGVYPFQSIDQYTLHDGDTVNLYFGSPNRVTLSSDTVATNESFVATAESYDAAAGTFVPIPGVTLGVTQPDPNNPWSPTEIATSTADQNGQATFTIATAGTYGVGTEESGFYPETPLTVVATTTSATSTNTSSTGGTSGGSGGGSSASNGSVNTASAFSYLISNQNADGSFVSPLITDWAALALALSDAPSSARSKLASYLTGNQPSLSAITDYERHAMALMALGINPYTGTSVNDITPIVQAFDGTEIGDASLINNDIFGLIVLPHAGYSTSDSIIQKTTSFLISQQAGNGSWVGSTDLTGAAIQALTPLTSLPGVSAAIAKAENYLHGQEQSDGSFGNSFSTSWVLGGINARGETMSQWTVSNATPMTSLAGLQQADGGIDLTSASSDARTWATAYALTAVEGRSWSSLLGNFAKPSGVTTNSGGGTTASTTVPVATTTPAAPTATTTPITLVLPTLPLVVPTATTTPVYTVPFFRTVSVHAPVPATGTGTTTPETNSLASVDAAPAAQSFWHLIANVFGSIFSFFSHLL